MKSIVLAAASFLVVASPGIAADTPAEWLKHPNSRGLLSVWPPDALKRGIGGQAVIQCKVSVQGTLFDCFVESEKPQGSGFGRAAIMLTPQLLLRPATRDGQPVVSDVRVPIDFPTPEAPTGTHLRGAKGAYARERLVTVISGIPWEAAPSYDDVVAAYPKRARQKSAGGRATLDCRITAESRLQGCDIITEEPKGMGFGHAARSLAPAFQAPAAGPKGESLADLHTQISIAFSPKMLDPAERVTGKPKWVGLPSSSSFQAVYPEAAKAAGVRQARVVMKCGVGVSGALEKCVVESEEPSGLGFGAATLSLSDAFRLNLWSDEGLPVIGGLVRAPVRYDLPTEAPPKP